MNGASRKREALFENIRFAQYTKQNFHKSTGNYGQFVINHVQYTLDYYRGRLPSRQEGARSSVADEAIQVSVIIPTYNRKALLMRSVQSVLDQNGVTLEVIVVDDGSDDGTPEALEALNDARVRVIRAAHGGACAARNLGIDAARGKYIAFQDSDDVFLPGKLSRQMAVLEESGADAVFCRFRRVADGAATLIPPDGVKPGPVTHEKLLFENLVSTQTILGTRASLAATRFDERYPRLQDWEMVLRYTQRFRLVYHDDVLVEVYEQPDSISRRPEKAMAALRMLLATYRGEYRRDEAALLHMRDMMQLMAIDCGETIWRDCLGMLSPHVSLAANISLARRGLTQLGHALLDRRKQS